jgi:hypothetical protein
MVRRHEGLELGAQRVGAAVRVLVPRRNELPEVAAMDVVAAQCVNVVGGHLLHEAGAVKFAAQRHFPSAPRPTTAHPRMCGANRKTGTLQ